MNPFRGAPGSCFFCKRMGHFVRECPDRHKCFRCGSLWHYIRDCTYPPRRGERRPFNGCRFCGQLYHWKRDCDLVHEMRNLGINTTGIQMCRNCFQNGHWARFCPHARRMLPRLGQQSQTLTNNGVSVGRPHSQVGSSSISNEAENTPRTEICDEPLEIGLVEIADVSEESNGTAEVELFPAYYITFPLEPDFSQQQNQATLRVHHAVANTIVGSHFGGEGSGSTPEDRGRAHAATADEDPVNDGEKQEN